MPDAVDNGAVTIFPPASTISSQPRMALSCRRNASNHKWRSSLDADNKCHLTPRTSLTTSEGAKSYELTKPWKISIETLSGGSAFIRRRTIQGGDRRLVY